jgi:hypothetical protein
VTRVNFATSAAKGALSLVCSPPRLRPGERARAAIGIARQSDPRVRLGVSEATTNDVRNQPKVADAASLPFGTPVELKAVFEASD